MRLEVFCAAEPKAGDFPASILFLAASHYNKPMTPPLSHVRRSRTPPPGDTGQEALYLRSLSDRQVSVQVQLRDGETIDGWIEYFDDGMIRITRDGHPNLFIYKHQIRSITEMLRRRLSRRVGSSGNGS
jgi:host factor-I protein